MITLRLLREIRQPVAQPVPPFFPTRTRTTTIRTQSHGGWNDVPGKNSHRWVPHVSYMLFKTTPQSTSIPSTQPGTAWSSCVGRPISCETTGQAPS